MAKRNFKEAEFALSEQAVQEEFGLHTLTMERLTYLQSLYRKQMDVTEDFKVALAEIADRAKCSKKALRRIVTSREKDKEFELFTDVEAIRMIGDALSIRPGDDIRNFFENDDDGNVE